MNMGYTALVLTPESRTQLLERFAPKFARVICHHITLAFNVPEDTVLPEPGSVQIVGYACDENGVEALVVALDGETDRPDGSYYHITLSLGHGRKPKESNDLIVHSGYALLDAPVTISAPAAFVPFG